MVLLNTYICRVELNKGRNKDLYLQPFTLECMSKI